MKKIISYGITHWLIGLLGLNWIVLVHEFGHFIVCKLLNVATPIFSIGFGPSIASITLAGTRFQLALLPLGGYVSIDPADFASQPYLQQLIILLAGIACNIIFTGLIFIYLKYLSPLRHTLLPHTVPGESHIKVLGRMMAAFFAQEGRTGVIGFIGIISVTGKSLALGFDFFLFVLAILSLNVGLFNLLPIPFFDGGQIVMITIQKLIGPLSEPYMNFFYFVILILISLFILAITFKDIRYIKKQK
ncbi:MAG: site-2 protease family protein [bacterium]|nr:site-2 protease family protein [bacterium]